MWEIGYKVKDMKPLTYWPLYRSECKHTAVDGSVLQSWIGFYEAATLSLAAVACSCREQLLRDSSQWREPSVARKVQCHHALQSAVNLKSKVWMRIRRLECWVKMCLYVNSAGQQYSTTHLNAPLLRWCLRRNLVFYLDMIGEMCRTQTSLYILRPFMKHPVEDKHWYRSQNSLVSSFVIEKECLHETKHCIAIESFYSKIASSLNRIGVCVSNFSKINHYIYFILYIDSFSAHPCSVSSRLHHLWHLVNFVVCFASPLQIVRCSSAENNLLLLFFCYCCCCCCAILLLFCYGLNAFYRWI